MTLQSLQPCRVFCRILPGGKRPGRPVVPAPATLRCITRLLILSAPSEPAIFPAIRAEEGRLINRGNLAWHPATPRQPRTARVASMVQRPDRSAIAFLRPHFAV